MADSETRKLIIQFEKKICHMYQDSEGNVTIGIGHLIRGENEASRINLRIRDDNTLAHGNQKINDYVEVKNAPKKMHAKNYAKYTTLIISNYEMNKLFEVDISEIERLVKYYFPKYDTYPLGVRRVLLDMAYNKGAKGTKNHENGKFSKAIEEKDWLTAAKLCKRGHHSDRDKWAKDTLMQVYYKHRIKPKTGVSP